MAHFRRFNENNVERVPREGEGDGSSELTPQLIAIPLFVGDFEFQGKFLSNPLAWKGDCSLLQWIPHINTGTYVGCFVFCVFLFPHCSLL